MCWRRTPLTPPYIRALLRNFSSSSATTHFHPHHQLFPPKPSFILPPSLAHKCTPNFLSLPFSLSSSLVRPFSSNSESASEPFPENQEDPIAQSLSSELLKDTSDVSDSLSLAQRLDLSFSHITVSDSLILNILNLSSGAGRLVLGFLKWVHSRPDFKPTDETFSYFVNYFGRRHDFKSAHNVLLDGRGVAGPKTLESMVNRLVRAGRPTQVMSFFDKMDKDYGFVRTLDSLKLVITNLCEYGFASHAEKMVKNLANEFFPDEYICDALIKGWCVDGKLNEAKRLADEMYRGGFDIGVTAYNAMLDCVCKLCRKKDPFRLKSEAENVLIAMERTGVPRNVETFNVLISNLCKIRMTEDAMKLFHKMGEWGCSPNEETFLLLIRSLYQAARVGEGDEMIDRMKSARCGDALDKKAYYGFLKILCGIERVDHAMMIFAKMKEDGCRPGIETYDLLMGKLGSQGRVDNANVLYKEAESNGIPMTPKTYKLDPRFVKKPKDVKKKKKRETLSEKMARKRRSLRKFNLSFVKKPKRMMRRSF